MGYALSPQTLATNAGPPPLKTINPTHSSTRNALHAFRPEHQPVSVFVFVSAMLLALLALLTLPLSIQSLSILCAGNLYGQPRPADALALSKSLPYMKSDPDGDMDKVRIFAEPEFFTPRFHGLVNRWETDMVQLPRVWRYRESNRPFSCSLNF